MHFCKKFCENVIADGGRRYRNSKIKPFKGRKTAIGFHRERQKNAAEKWLQKNRLVFDKEFFTSFKM